MDCIKLFVADDHSLIRESMIRTLGSAEGIEISGSASDGKEACSKILESKPDLVLIDLSSDEMRSDEVIRLVRRRNEKIRFILMTDADYSAGITKCRADGFVSKSAKKEEFLRVIREVAQADHRNESPVELKDNGDFSRGEDSKLRNAEGVILTKKEKEILSGLRRGKSEKRVAKELALERQTVEQYRINLCRKFGLKNSSQFFSFLMNDPRVENLLRN